MTNEPQQMNVGWQNIYVSGSVLGLNKFWNSFPSRALHLFISGTAAVVVYPDTILQRWGGGGCRVQPHHKANQTKWLAIQNFLHNFQSTFFQPKFLPPSCLPATTNFSRPESKSYLHRWTQGKTNFYKEWKNNFFFSLFHNFSVLDWGKILSNAIYRGISQKLDF